MSGVITIWVPATKEQALAVLVARRNGETWDDLLPGVMAANYDSNGEVGEWDGLEVEDLESYELMLSGGIDLMDDWGPFVLTFDIHEVIAKALGAMTPETLAATLAYREPEAQPRCDICDQPDNPDGAADWNGETGNHLSCEA